MAVRDLRYFGSQSWPFPNSLMIAFTAEYAGGELRHDPAELADARWFPLDALPQMPPRLSIARALIDDTLARVRARVAERFPADLERIRDYLRMPSVSATGEGIGEVAEATGAWIEGAGGSFELVETPGHPLVLGELPGPAGAPRLLRYGMYDVQPAQEPEWTSPPFAAEVRDLPGVGDYTAAAIAVFAHTRRHPVLDTNVRRVLTRLLDGRELPPATVTVSERAQAEALLPADAATAATWSMRSSIS